MDAVGKLIRQAGPRADVDSDRFNKARARVEAHWETVVAEQRKPHATGFHPGLAAAASVLLIVAAGFFALRPGPSWDAVTVARVAGDVRVDGQAIAPGDALPVDAVVETASGSRVALQLRGGRSLRIDENTRLVAGADSRFGLERGAVYFDSGRSADAAPVFIDTPQGVATDVGTQFQVRLLGKTLVIGVREGLVALSRPDREELTVDRGHVLEVADDGSAEQRPIEDDSMWDWAGSIAPEIDTNGMTLADYVDWYARENGYAIEWADSDTRDSAMNTRLNVSIQGLTLDEGLAVVQAVAPFDYAIDDATMRIDIER